MAIDIQRAHGENSSQAATRRITGDGRNEASAWRWVDEATGLVEADEHILHSLWVANGADLGLSIYFIYFNWISRKGTWDILSLVFFFWVVAASPMRSELQWLISTRAMWQAYHHVVPYSEKSSSSSSTQCCRIWYAHLVALGCCFLPLITVIMPSMKQHETSKNHSWDYVIQHEYFGACDWCWITGSGAGFTREAASDTKRKPRHIMSSWHIRRSKTEKLQFALTKY